MKHYLAHLIVGTAFFYGVQGADAHDNIRVIGTITGYKESAVKVMTKEGAESWIQVNDDTEISRDQTKVGAAELKPGRYVVVDGWGDDFYSLDALKIRLVPAPTK